MSNKKIDIPLVVQEAVLKAFNDAEYGEAYDEYDGVEYLGIWKGYYVFTPNYIGKEDAFVGFEPFFIVKGNKAKIITYGKEEFDEIFQYEFDK